MTTMDGIGYLAGSLVVATFYTRGWIELRCLAIASNLAFMSYGYLGGLHPVLLLHAVLLPLNIIRLLELHRKPSPDPRGVPGALARSRMTRRIASIETDRGTSSGKLWRPWRL